MTIKKYVMGVALATVAVAFIAGCAPSEKAPVSEESAAPAAAAPAAGSASITGVVSYSNGDPDTVIAMDADPMCLSLHTDDVHTETIVTDGAGHLANVFVYVKEGISGSFSAPSDSHVLDQNGCQYKPHVSGMLVGQPLIIRNSDSTLHNVHAMPTVNKEFNSGQPFQGMELEHTWDAREVMVRFKCDVHPWMSSYMGVLDHPFFGVSDADGNFSIDGLAAGDYVLEAWHEKLGTLTQSATLEADGTADVSFDFSPEASAPSS